MTRCAALNTGPDFHLLDHIAPLAHLMNMPLLVTEEKNHELALHYYPQVTTRYLPDLEYQLGPLAAEFDALFECKYWAPHLKPLFLDLYRKNIRLVFCPHGQSDKGYATPLLAPYAEQDLVLLYGPLMQQMLRELNIAADGPQIGNYRHLHYLRNKPFYDTLATREIFSHLPPNKKILLYAPTWSDADQATTFFQWAPTLLAHIPEEWTLLLKVHPLCEQRDPARYYRVAALAEHAGAHLVSDFPPVYPLLARADAYLGDYSSVGYDYLTFRRPMFFFLNPTLPRGRLHTCGTILDSPRALSLELNKRKDFSAQQAALYNHAFGDDVPDPRTAILTALNRPEAATQKVSPNRSNGPQQA